MGGKWIAVTGARFDNEAKTAKAHAIEQCRRNKRGGKPRVKHKDKTDHRGSKDLT